MRTCLVLLSILWAGVAEARDVYLNGVKLDASVTIEPQTFKDCEVRVAQNGDIHISAKGYKVAVTAPAIETTPGATAAPPSRAASATRGYWLVTKQTQRGAVQYDVDVFINDAHVKKVRSVDDPTVIDVSRYVQPGRNRVRIVAVKNIGERRVSMSPTDSMEILIGEGSVGGGTVTVDKVHLSFKRTAADVQNVREDLEFSVK
jgi:hypothetical protein